MAETQARVLGLDREYETIFVLRPDVDRERSEEISGRMTDIIGREGGKLTRIESWGRRRLAYPVQKHKRGIYVYLKYLGKGGLVSELERNLRLLDAVLKYQTVKLADGLDVAAVEVSAEDVKFEHVEGMPDADDADEAYVRVLGLEDRSMPPEGHVPSLDDAEDFEASEEETESTEEEA